MIAVLAGCAALNAGADLSTAVEYRAADALGFGPALCGTAVLGADARTLYDLNRSCGPATALWAPVGLSAGMHTVGWLTGTPGLPALSSVIISGLVWLVCREEKLC